jgi:hypothetical protein
MEIDLGDGGVRTLRRDSIVVHVVGVGSVVGKQDDSDMDLPPDWVRVESDKKPEDIDVDDDDVVGS